MLVSQPTTRSPEQATDLKGRALVDGRLLGVSHTGGVHRYVRQIVEALQQAMPLDVARPRLSGRIVGQLWEHLVLGRLAKNYDLLFCPANVAPLHVASQTRLVVMVHGLNYLRNPGSYSWAFGTYHRLLMPRVMRRADRVLTVSQAAGDEMLEQYPFLAGKLDVIPSGVGAVFGPPKIDQRGGDILFVGRAAPAKGLAHLLEAFEQLARSTDSRLRIVGTTPQAFIQANPQAATRVERLESRLEWVGQINDPAEMARTYQSARLFVCPSTYETFSLPPLEAMACGTPAVISDIPAHRENYAAGAHLVEAHNVGQLAQAMDAVVNDQQRFDQLQRAGFQLSGQFTWQRCAKRTIEVFEEVLDQP